MSRRQVLAGAGGTGLLAAAASPAKAATRARRARAGRGGGTPEQIHLTWSENPATGVVVSWASPGQARRPRVRIGQRVIPAEPRPYTDGISGETVWTYHARVGGLRPGATYAYAVTADNDSDAADPFSATFRTAPAGRAPFRFTSFGDLATPNTAWVLSYGQSAYAVEAVESFQPLFHLLNGDLCYANLNPTAQPEVWRDSGVFDTSNGTVHLILGCGGTDAPLDEYGTDTADNSPFPGGSPPRTPPRQAKVFTRADRPVPSSTPGVFTRAAADAVEDAIRSAKRDTVTGYGIAVFDVDPGSGFDDQPSIKVTHYHAVGADPVNPASGTKGAPTPDYTEFETFTLVRPR
jgi:predicted secreted protein